MYYIILYTYVALYTSLRSFTPIDTIAWYNEMVFY